MCTMPDWRLVRWSARAPRINRPDPSMDVTSMAPVISSPAILCAPNETKAGPRLIDCTDFVINESKWKGHIPHYVVRYVGHESRRLLRPRNPQSAAWEDQLAQARYTTSKRLRARDEHYDNVCRSARSAPHGHHGRQID